MEFGKKLKKIRLEKGLSQQNLADRIFVSRSAVAKWENGLGLPSKASYEALTKIFDVPSDFFKTEDPEKLVVEKNRRIKRRSFSLYAVFGAAIVLFALWALVHPVPYFASANWDRIFIQPVSKSSQAFEVTDWDSVSHLIDLLNSTNFRKSLRPGREAPEHLKAVFSLRDSDGYGNDVWLVAKSHDKYSVYIWTGTKELIACNGGPLGNYMIKLLENQ